MGEFIVRIICLRRKEDGEKHENVFSDPFVVYFLTVTTLSGFSFAYFIIMVFSSTADTRQFIFVKCFLLTGCFISYIIIPVW